MAWRYRGACVRAIAMQVALIALGLLLLSMMGLGVDIIRHAVQPDSPAPRFPFAWVPPADWTARGQVAVLAGAMVVAALLRALLAYGYGMVVARLLQAEIVVDLRRRVYDKLQRLSFRFFDANASAGIINRVTGDVQNVRLFVDGVIIQGLVLTLSLLVFLAYMLHLHAGLTLVCLASTPVLVLSSLVFAAFMKQPYAQSRDLVDALVGTLSEHVQGVQVVKGFAREDAEVRKFAAANAAVRDQQRGIFWRISLFGPAMGFLTQLNLVLALAYGGYLVIGGELALGTGLMVFTGLLQQWSGQVGNIVTITNSLQQSLISARRVFEVLDAPIEIASLADAQRLGKARGELAFEQVDFAYTADAPVLRQVSFSARPGQVVAILGATGSGKTSLMGLIPRFYDPTAGRVLVDGVDVRMLAVDDLRRNVGIVFQESFLFSNTVAANIAFGHPEATRAQIEAAARIACAHDFVSALPHGYDTVLGEAGIGLSGGQRQRLSIARALLLEPSILLLDDPTAAIDPETERDILQAMDQAIAGRTTLIVAHRVSTLRRADLILVLEDGAIVQRGTHAELMATHGPYQRVARLQLSDRDALASGASPEQQP
ncbi:MAG: ABC transporter ATP-binding protein [Planctomycetes bacterium]|nr:ABC transporter ATP-binding protein [Planctomycetota bacterium]